MSLLDADFYPDSLQCDNCIHTAKSHDSLGCTEIECSCVGFAPAPGTDDGPENAEEAEAERLGLR